MGARSGCSRQVLRVVACMAVFGEFDAGYGHSVALVESGCFPPRTFCSTKLNSLGCRPAIGSSGTPRASAGGGFTITGSNVRNHERGLLLHSLDGQAAIPFRNDTLCLANPIRRTPTVNSAGSAPPINDCTGVYSIDFNTFAVGALGGSPLPALRSPGSVVDAQGGGAIQVSPRPTARRCATGCGSRSATKGL